MPCRAHSKAALTMFRIAIHHEPIAGCAPADASDARVQQDGARPRPSTRAIDLLDLLAGDPNEIEAFFEKLV